MVLVEFTQGKFMVLYEKLYSSEGVTMSLLFSQLHLRFPKLKEVLSLDLSLLLNSDPSETFSVVKGMCNKVFPQ